MKFKRIVSFVLLIAMMASVIANDNMFSFAEEADGEKQEEYEEYNGYRSEIHDNSVPVRKKTEQQSRAIIPSAYPSGFETPADVVERFANYYPSTRNQGEYGTCWAFGALACAEFDFVTNQIQDSDFDLSELHLAYFMYNQKVDPLKGISGDINAVGDPSENFMTVGGNTLYSMNVLAQHCGPANESLFSYDTAGTILQGGIKPSLGILGRDETQAYLQSAYIININEQAGRNAIKEKIVSEGLGAACISYYDDYTCYNTADDGTVNYYKTVDSSGITTNHVVAIIGWDDYYSRENFSSLPPADGAWLVRNSKSTSTGNSEDSYFWLSYYDETIADAAYALDFVRKPQLYKYNYQYDGVATHSGVSAQKAANIFTAQNPGNTASEALTAVRLTFSEDTDVNYQIDIYTDLKKSNDPESGHHETAATTTGKTTYAGIYTIELKSPVIIAPNEKYAVVVTFTDGSAKIDREKNVDSWIKTTSAIEQNQSFFSTNGKSWIDCANYSGYGNISIKGLTKDSKIGKYKLKYVLDGGINSDNNPDRFFSTTSSITLEDASKIGHHFDGWYLDEEYNYEVTEISGGFAGNTTLYAKWVPCDLQLVKSTVATCTESAKAYYECTLCDYAIMEETAAANGHEVVEDAGVVATCTEPGLTAGTHCSICDTVLVEQNVIPAAGHNKVTDEAVTETCTEPGYTEGEHCSKCNEVFVAQEMIPATGHNSVWQLNKASTKVSGSNVNSCTTCGEVLSKDIIPRIKTVSLSSSSYTYNGNVKTPSITVRDTAGNKLVKNTDYTVKYASGRKKIGTYKVTVTFKGDYTGTSTKSFKINPKGTYIRNLARGSKRFTVKWKKQTSYITGYQIQYSVKSSFTNARIKSVSSKKSTSSTVKKLKGKKRYYVRVRTYKIVKVNGNKYTYYSQWSAKKRVTTKK